MFAQDAHYWTEQYGTKSMLLSNSVVGSVEDLGAVYYNPGRLGLIENPALLLSAKIYQISKLSIKDAVGEGWNINKSNFGGVPSLTAGTFKFKKLPKHKFAYSFLTRSTADDDFSTRSDTYGDVVDILPGEEYFNGETTFRKKIREDWMGVTWSLALNPRLGIGVSTFFTTKKQEAYNQVIINSLSENNEIDVYTNIKRYSFNNYGLIWKMGVSYVHSRFRFGLTVATPTLSLKGSGKFEYRHIFTGIQEDAAYTHFYQDNLDLTYRSPFSVAAGISSRIFKGTIHMSGEYFGKISKYDQMATDPFEDRITGEEHTLTLYNELNSVFNFGIGYDIRLNKKLSAYISYSTNKSAAVSSGNNSDEQTYDILASTFNSDINNFGLGVVMNFNETNITLGATYAYASFDIKRPVDFPDDESDRNIILDPEAYSSIDWQRWRIIVGISIPFLKDVARKFENEWESKWKDKKKNK
ncbi:MAG: hypothetical protein GXO47_10480 [Chlorobi bacterium]|nr:hypothetical protein [Chlorobiota bacterium]